MKDLLIEWLLKNKWFRLKCIKEYIRYVETFQNKYPDVIAFLCCYHQYEDYNNEVKWWVPCWTKIKEIRLNKDSYLVNNINCGGIQFKSNSDRIKFLKECLRKS